MTRIQNQLEGIEKHIHEQTILKKETLKLSEAALYLGVSKSYLYKLTSKREIPFYRVGDKLIFFFRSELDAWVQTNKCTGVGTNNRLTSKSQSASPEINTTSSIPSNEKL